MVWVVHTLKELNRPEIRHKTNKHLVINLQVQQNYFTVTECNVKVKVHVTYMLIKQMDFLRVILFDLAAER